MEDFDLYTIAAKSVKGVFSLVSRTFFVQVLGIVSQLIIAAYLDTASFGVFFVVSSIVVFLTYFQDIGLAASLIQKKEEPTIHELRSTFTMQQLLIICLLVPALIFSPQIAGFYHLNTAGYYLYLSLLFSFFLSSFRTIPTIILERRLEFSKLVLPEIVEMLCYNSALIIFAVLGYGITTFTIAVIVRSVVGLIVLYRVQSWDIGIEFDFKSLKELISFGLPFQANTVLALIKDNLLTLYLGKVLPLSQVGYIGFAEKWAYVPLRLVMDNVIKVTFPSYSRLQHDKKALRVVVEKSLFLIAAVIFPFVVGIMMLSPFFIEFIPKYHKWEPALLSLFLFSINAAFASITVPITNFLNAIGKVRLTLYFMIAWTIMIWGGTIMAIKVYGYNGVALVSCLVAISTLLVLIPARKYVKFSFFRPIYKQIIAVIGMAIFIFVIKSMISSMLLLFVVAAIAGIVYFIILGLLAKKEIKLLTAFIRQSLRQ